MTGVVRRIRVTHVPDALPAAEPKRDTRAMAGIRGARRKDVPRSWRYLDGARLQAWKERRNAGEGPLEAWLAILTDKDLGQRRYRGLAAVPAQVVQRTFVTFLERAAPEAVLVARAEARMEAAAMVGRMMHVVSSIAEGEFGEGKVEMQGRGAARHEVVRIDAAAAAVRHSAARTVLQIAGALPSAGSGQGVQVNTQVNVGAEHDTAARLAADPEAQRSAIDAARRLVPQVDTAVQ